MTRTVTQAAPQATTQATTPAPLHGKRVIITRPREQATSLANALRDAGAETVVVPAIRVVPRGDHAALDAALTSLTRYQWLVFTSSAAAAIVSERLLALNVSIDSTRLTVAVVGPATASVLDAHGVHVTCIPTPHLASQLPAAMRVAAGARVLWPHGSASDTAFADTLRASHASVDDIIVYDTVSSIDPDMLRCALAQGADAITFASASAAHAVIEALGDDAATVLGRTTVACIGPRAAEPLYDRGIPVAVIAADHTAAGLAHALTHHLTTAATGAADGVPLSIND
jgi:uroporphyrinogen III methyltransferase/synthase